MKNIHSVIFVRYLVLLVSKQTSGLLSVRSVFAVLSIGIYLRKYSFPMSIPCTRDSGLGRFCGIILPNNLFSHSLFSRGNKNIIRILLIYLMCLFPAHDFRACVKTTSQVSCHSRVCGNLLLIDSISGFLFSSGMTFIGFSHNLFGRGNKNIIRILLIYLMCLFPAHDFSRGNKNIIQILLTVSTVSEIKKENK